MSRTYKYRTTAKHPREKGSASRDHRRDDDRVRERGSRRSEPDGPGMRTLRVLWKHKKLQRMARDYLPYYIKKQWQGSLQDPRLLGTLTPVILIWMSLKEVPVPWIEGRVIPDDFVGLAFSCLKTEQKQHLWGGIEKCTKADRRAVSASGTGSSDERDGRTTESMTRAKSGALAEPTKPSKSASKAKSQFDGSTSTPIKARRSRGRKRGTFSKTRSSATTRGDFLAGGPAEASATTGDRSCVSPTTRSASKPRGYDTHSDRSDKGDKKRPSKLQTTTRPGTVATRSDRDRRVAGKDHMRLRPQFYNCLVWAARRVGDRLEGIALRALQDWHAGREERRRRSRTERQQQASMQQQAGSQWHGAQHAGGPAYYPMRHEPAALPYGGQCSDDRRCHLGH